MTDREGAGGGLRQTRIGQLGRTPKPALTTALLVVQASGEISVHALVRVHCDISPGPHSRPGGRSRGTANR